MFDALDQPPPVHIIYPRPSEPSLPQNSFKSGGNLLSKTTKKQHCFYLQCSHMFVLVLLQHMAIFLFENSLKSFRNLKLLFLKLSKT